MSELVLSNSRANTFRRCQKQYEFRYVLKWRKKDLGLPLFRGDWLHQLLMVHYDGYDWRERHAALKAQNWDNLFADEREALMEELGGDLATEVERLFKGYLAYYREEDTHWRVVDSEVNETIDLPNGMRLNIIIDLIVEDLDDGTLWIWDHKTVSRFYPLDFMLIDSQLALYAWGASVLGYDITGVILNELITKPPTLPKFLEPSQRFEMRKNIHCDAYSYFACIKAAGQDPRQYKKFLEFLKTKHGDWWRRTRMPRDEVMVKRVMREMMATGDDIERILERGMFTRTARKECQFDCDFLEPCMAQLQGIDIQSIFQLKYQHSKRPPEEEQLKKLWPSNEDKKKVTSHG